LDEIDLAQANDELFRQQALRAHFRAQHNFGDATAVRTATAGAVGYAPRPDLNCIDCEEEIGNARLAANPEAIRCIDCQTKFERRAQRG